MTLFGLVTISLILCSLSQAASGVNVIRITNDSTASCTGQSCPITLSDLAANFSNYVRSKTLELVFSPGTHYLNRVNLSFLKFTHVKMNSENFAAQIQCRNSSRIYFNESLHIHITNLEFIGCGGNQVRHARALILSNVKFDGQDVSGTALELIGTTAQIINSTFVSNIQGTLRKCAGYEIPPLRPHTLTCYGNGKIPVGGAIISTSSEVNISHSKFEDNRAFFGGAILAEYNSIINIFDKVKFINNTATAGGGVLYSFFSTIIIKASEFHNNTGAVLFSYHRGAVLCSYHSNVTIEASKFAHNNATYEGGVLTSSYSNITIQASRFDGNYGGSWGGVLTSINSNITIQESHFRNNSADAAGALYLLNSDVKIDGSDFHNNSAKHQHGVVGTQSSSVTIKRSNFSDSSSTIDGGALSFSRSTTTIEACFFRDNRALLGGVLSSHKSYITIEASDFHDNSATISGGALDAEDSTITIESSDFHNNSAQKEGGVLFSRSSTITIGSCTFNQNSAPVGAIMRMYHTGQKEQKKIKQKKIKH